jgi:hypothetical protein
MEELLRLFSFKTFNLYGVADKNYKSVIIQFNDVFICIFSISTDLTTLNFPDVTSKL